MQDFQILGLLSQGAFSNVYQVKDAQNKVYALKLQALDDMYENEVKIFRKIQKSKVDCFPKMKQCGVIEGSYGYIVMELLGQNSLELMKKRERREHSEQRTYGLPLAAVVSIATQLITILQEFHSTGHLHSDVKPNNIVIELNKDVDDLYKCDLNGVAPSNKTKVYLLDYGLCENYLTKQGIHINQQKIKRLQGNKFFMSLNQLEGNVSSRRDDLEQLMYSVIFLARGDLPWSLKATYSQEDILKAKSSPQIIDLMLKDLPQQFRQCFNYIRNLKFQEEPNYQWLKEVFMSILKIQAPQKPSATKNYHSYSLSDTNAKFFTKSFTTKPSTVTPQEINEIKQMEKLKAQSSPIYSFQSHNSTTVGSQSLDLNTARSTLSRYGPVSNTEEVKQIKHDLSEINDSQTMKESILEISEQNEWDISDDEDFDEQVPTKKCQYYAEYSRHTKSTNLKNL